MLILPAHGALGPWDEIIFVAVAVVFVAMMAISWLRSRSDAGESDLDEADTSEKAKVDENRFELK
jgi:hypothetical protein